MNSGIFTVSLDFGADAFSGGNRFLEISARLSGGSFNLLTPRQQITSTPYAVRSFRSTLADGLSGACAGCVGDSNINAIAGSKVSGTIPVTSVPAGSASYIQNTNSPQAGSNFNISGTGSANSFDAETQYDIGGNRVLSVAGTDNTFAGVNAGKANTGSQNSFFGRGAGFANLSGIDNAFFGYRRQSEYVGQFQLFFGAQAPMLLPAGSKQTQRFRRGLTRDSDRTVLLRFKPEKKDYFRRI